MKVNDSRIEFWKTERKWKVNKLLNTIDYIEHEIRQTNIISKYASKSLKKISKELKSFPKLKKLKFTASQKYLEGKKKISALNRESIHRKSVDNLIKIMESKTPEPQNFLTSEIIAKKCLNKNKNK